VFNEQCGCLRNADERGRDPLCGGFPMVSVVCWWTIVLLMGVARKVISGPRLCLSSQIGYSVQDGTETPSGDSSMTRLGLDASGLPIGCSWGVGLKRSW